MKCIIDHLNDVTGWSITAPGTFGLNGDSRYIAGLNSNSLYFVFETATGPRVASKTLPAPVDVSECKTLIFSVWSPVKGDSRAYKKAADFQYKIKLNDTDEYYMPVYSSFNQVLLGIEEVSFIDRIEITPLHNDHDYLIVSEMVAEKEEILLDIVNESKAALEYVIKKKIGDDGLLLGTSSVTAGSNQIDLSGLPYLDRFGTFLITDGVNSERHQIADGNGTDFYLNDNYDGSQFLNSYVDAQIFLLFPVSINPGQYEIQLPGVSVWASESAFPLRGSKFDFFYDTFRTDNIIKGRVDGQIVEFTVNIDCEARSRELIMTMAEAVRLFISNEILWVNGIKSEIFYSGPPEEINPSSGVDYIPRIRYSFRVDIKEFMGDREIFPRALPPFLSVDVKED